MPDIADLAGPMIDLLNSEAVRRATGKSGPESHPDFDGETCVGCGDEISPIRLRMGRVRCVDCQARLERGLK